MPSTASSFIIGMATALAIAGGFAGTFMESVSKQRSTDLALREQPKAADWSKAHPLSTRSETTVLRGSVDGPGPSTSGVAAPPAPSPAPTPSVNRPDTSQPTRAAAIDKATDTHANSPAAQQPPTIEKKVRKQRPVRKKPKLEWYEDENIASNRNRGGLFGMFR